jgi:hypothetical protein
LASEGRFNIPDLEEVRSILHGVAENHRFIAVMPEIEQQLGSSFSFANGGVSVNTSPVLSSPQIPNAVCESVDIPPFTIDSDQRFGGGTKINVPRFTATQPITINFYEDEYYNVSKYLWAWRMLMVDGSRLYNLPTVYKKDIGIWAFDSINNYAPVIMANMIECSPAMVGGGLSYSHANNGFLTVSCEFHVDNMEFEFTGGQQSRSYRQIRQPTIRRRQYRG